MDQLGKFEENNVTVVVTGVIAPLDAGTNDGMIVNRVLSQTGRIGRIEIVGEGKRRCMESQLGK